MIKSMTGYGRASELVGGREITVEIKCVNHRYLEPSIKTPRALSHFEQRIKDEVVSAVVRGKLEVYLSVVNRTVPEETVEPNLEAARGYVEAIARLSDEFSLKNDLTACILARFPDVFTVQKLELDEDALWQDCRAVLLAALENFNIMRQTEGARLADDVCARLNDIETLLTGVERDAADAQGRYFERIYKRMREVLEATDIDEQRVLAEAAIYADKAAVDEETVRLRSHISQMREFLKGDGPVGKKMDFLVQEFNRETNTIGSKANNIEITRSVVEMKAQIEKIREQIQNIE